MSKPAQTRSRNPAETRRELVAAATGLMLRQGFAGTTVDQICAEAGLSKGSFFHNFESKEAIGLAAMASFADAGMQLYAVATADADADPLAQLHRLIDIMAGLAREHGEQLMCVIGMLSQELAATNPTMRAAGAQHMRAWVSMAADLLAAAQRTHAPARPFDPEQVAWTLYSVWQGSMLIAKTLQRPQLVLDSVQHARAYIDLLFADISTPPTR